MKNKIMAEQEPSPERSQENLELEIERLKKEIEARDEVIKNRNSFNFWVGKKIGSVFLGWQLKDSIHRLFGELTQGKVTQKTLADVTAHTLWRFTRIGMFAIFAALIPVVFLIIQTCLLSIQNKRIIQQTYLQEAERRSAQVFLFSNVQDKIDEELKDNNNTKDSLSDPTIGRIISLSLALKPYRYLEDDVLIKSPVSPERAQLLLSLLKIGLDTSSLLKILKGSNFSSAELSNTRLQTSFLKYIDLRRAKLIDAILVDADMRNVNLEFADLRDAFMVGTNLEGAFLSDADLKGAILSGANLRGARLLNADLSNADLWGADLRDAILIGAKFKNVVLKNTNFEGAIINDSKINHIEAYYRISKETVDGTTYSVLRKR